ncbi:O-antigen ligase family protein [Tsuneonella sp. HG094]
MHSRPAIASCPETAFLCRTGNLLRRAACDEFVPREGGGRGRRLKLFHTLRSRDEGKFWALALWILATFLMGGGARDDITSLVILRPLAAVMLAVAAYKTTAADMRPFRSLLAILGAIVALVGLQLVPLPPAVWQALPQRELIADIDRAADLGSVWRPLSIAPPRTWNALFALMVPVSVVLFAIRLDGRQSARMVKVVLAIGLLSVLFGALQLVGGSGAFQLYIVHNAGAANGLFANRNHQAVFLGCLFPLLAVFASGRTLDAGQRRFRTIVAATAALTLIPVLLITGSRAGLAFGIVGLLAALLVYRKQEPAPAKSRKPKQHRWQNLLADNRVIYAGFGVATTVLIGVTVFLSRAESLRRLLESGELGEMRVASLGPVSRLAMEYLPFGSGAGTFVEAFFRAEPRSFLAPTYLNHAHFDYLEWAVTGGVPALAIVAVAAGFALFAAIRLFLRARIADAGVQLGRAGLVVLAILAGASIVDYPLRTPAISAFAGLAAVWVWRGAFAKKPGAPA